MADEGNAGQDTFEPITTQEAAEAWAAAHVPDEYVKAAETAKEFEEKLRESQRALAAAEVAAETGVPAAALTGATREEMKEAASRLLKWRESSAPKPKPSAAPLKRPGLSSGASGAGEPLSPKAAAAAALRRMRGSE